MPANLHADQPGRPVPLGTDGDPAAFRTLCRGYQADLHADGEPDLDADPHANSDLDRDANGDGDAYPYADANADADGYAHSNGHGDVDANADCDGKPLTN